MSAMFKTILNSPWSGAVGALMSALWEGFWLTPIGLSGSDVKWYLALGLFAMLLSGGQAFYILKKKNTALEDKINSAPNLVACRTSDARTNVGADFYHLKIANDPTGTLNRQTAEKVVGTVQICDQYGQPLAPARVHRWAASPYIPGFPNASDLQLPIDIDANGIEHSFDVVLKFEEESEFFTHNNESVARYGYKDPNYKFGPGTYIANIDIKGKNIAAKFRCKIVNLGANSKLDVSVLQAQEMRVTRLQ